MAEDKTPDFEELSFSEEEAADIEPAGQSEQPDGAEPEADQNAPVEVEAEQQEAELLFEDEEEQPEPIFEQEDDPEEEQGEAGEEEEEEEEEEKKKGLVARILTAMANANPYTVLLGIALLAILLAIFCMWREWAKYEYDTKAKTAAAVPGVQLHPVMTTAAAWPIGVQLISSADGAEGLSGRSRIT